jgi:four helix bundle protein
MAEGLEGLRIFRLAEALADEVWAEVLTWSPFARQTVGRQLVEAADSVGANIAEGYGRFHFKDSRQFQYYARGSLQETNYWLRRARIRKLMTERRARELMERTAELAPQLNAYIRTLDRRSQVERRHQSDGTPPNEGVQVPVL